MTTPLNGQIIGQAERTTRAVLDRLLARTGTGFDQWVALSLAATTGVTGVTGLADALRIDPVAAEEIIGGLRDAGLLTSSGALTPAGQERHDQIRAGITGITERLYGDLPADELAVAGRILTTITDRARAELAA
jgi:hypothetical protein